MFTLMVWTKPLDEFLIESKLKEIKKFGTPDFAHSITCPLYQSKACGTVSGIRLWDLYFAELGLRSTKPAPCIILILTVTQVTNLDYREEKMPMGQPVRIDQMDMDFSRNTLAIWEGLIHMVAVKHPQLLIILCIVGLCNFMHMLDIIIFIFVT